MAYRESKVVDRLSAEALFVLWGNYLKLIHMRLIIKEILVKN